MVQEYKTIRRTADDAFVEQRSRFIGYAKPVQTESEAMAFVEEIRTKHWDATHNVYAYILREGQIRRFSDDGEPHGTAGMPTLDVLQKNDVTNLVVVVTRYFGGILLGAGGLVRAYSHGAKIALDAAGIITMRMELLCMLRCDYNQYGKLAALIPAFGGTIDRTDFADKVTLGFHMRECSYNAFLKRLADATCGSVVPEIIDQRFFQSDA